MKKVMLVEGMSCGHCVQSIKKGLLENKLLKKQDTT